MSGTEKRSGRDGAGSSLVAGTFVRVRRTSDPWLRRYSGSRGRVVRDDGLVADVVLLDGDLVSLWRGEVEPLPAGLHDERWERLLTDQDSVPGFSLQLERQRAGLTQMAIAIAMGVSVPRISQIESLPGVRAATAVRYLDALRTAAADAA